MPIYEYRCVKCGNIQSDLRKYDERDIFPKCDNCGSDTIRIMSGSVLKFRGSGFHETDYYKTGSKVK